MSSALLDLLDGVRAKDAALQSYRLDYEKWCQENRFLAPIADFENGSLAKKSGMQKYLYDSVSECKTKASVNCKPNADRISGFSFPVYICVIFEWEIPQIIYICIHHLRHLVRDLKMCFLEVCA